MILQKEMWLAVLLLVLKTACLCLLQIHNLAQVAEQPQQQIPDLEQPRAPGIREVRWVDFLVFELGHGGKEREST